MYLSESASGSASSPEGILARGESLLARRETGRAYCFLRNGRKIHKDAVARDFRKAADRIGLHDVTIHTLRHTFISQCLMADTEKGGISIWEVSKWVGHSSVYITELYGHLCPDRREIDKLQI